jgi:hypothetical protein
LAFHEHSDGTTEFIGRYNFNLDKGADHSLGMDVEISHPYVTYIDEETGEEKHRTFKEVCECWEMANNTGGRCSFRGDPFDYGYDYETKEFKFLNDKGELVLGHSDLGNDLEVRYHIRGDEIEGAWENRDKPLKDGGVSISAEEAFNVLLGGKKDEHGNLIEERTGAY